MLEIERIRTCVEVAETEEDEETLVDKEDGSEITIVPMLDITISHCSGCELSS